MSTTELRTRVAETQRTLDRADVLTRLRPLLKGIRSGPGDEVSMLGPGLGSYIEETSRHGLLKDADQRANRRVLRDQIRALLETSRLARDQKIALGDAARQYAEKSRACQEKAWVDVLEANRDREESVRWVSSQFANLQSSRKYFAKRLSFVDITAEELATPAGQDWLSDKLSAKVNRPDPRDSFGYVIVQGSAGSAKAVHQLAARVHEGRAIFVGDAPRFTSLDQIEASTATFLDKLPGTDTFLRHAILLGNPGRVRARFEGRYHQEKSDVYCDASAWFGLYLHNIAQGKPWVPPVGYQSIVPGMDGTLVDLQLQRKEGFQKLGAYRVNPLIRLADGSPHVVVQGADTLCEGVQMGVAVVEMQIARHAEWVVNRDGILRDLEEGEARLSKSLTDFVNLNSGAGREFRSGSRCVVHVDYEKKGFDIVFELRFREVAESAVIRICKDSENTATQLDSKTT